MMSRNLLVLPITFLMITLINCSDRRSCDDVVCGNNQSCINGNCYCLDGYEGPECQTIAAQKYVGNYTVVANCFQGSYIGSPFDFILWDGAYPNRITFGNFMNQGSVDAFIYTSPSNEGNIIEFAVNRGSFQANVSGQYLNNTGAGDILLNVQYYLGSQYGECQLTYYKQ